MAELITSVQEDFKDRVLPTIELVVTNVVGHWCFDTMRRAVENLVSKAVNYGDGSTIRIQSVETRERLFASVHNSGNPLLPKQLDQMFDYAQRGPHSVGLGWGIGLPFVKRAAGEHGGCVTVNSSAASGTTFLITIPINCRPFIASSAKPTVEPVSQT